MKSKTCLICNSTRPVAHAAFVAPASNLPAVVPKLPLSSALSTASVSGGHDAAAAKAAAIIKDAEAKAAAIIKAAENAAAQSKAQVEVEAKAKQKADAEAKAAAATKQAAANTANLLSEAKAKTDAEAKVAALFKAASEAKVSSTLIMRATHFSFSKMPQCIQLHGSESVIDGIYELITHQTPNFYAQRASSGKCTDPSETKITYENGYWVVKSTRTSSCLARFASDSPLHQCFSTNWAIHNGSLWRAHPNLRLLVVHPAADDFRGADFFHAVAGKCPPTAELLLTSLGLRVGAKIFDSGDFSEFSNREFHSRCDGKGPTIVIVTRIAGGPASIIGGFASQSWDSHSDFKSAPGSFVFSLIRREREFEGVWYQGFLRYDDESSNVLHCNTEYGPGFGPGDEEGWKGLHITAPVEYDEKTELWSWVRVRDCGPCEGDYPFPRTCDDGEFDENSCRILVFQAIR
jgi:hypothetical protein